MSNDAIEVLSAEIARLKEVNGLVGRELRHARADSSALSIRLEEANAVIVRLRAEIEQMRDDDALAARYANGEGPA